MQDFIATLQNFVATMPDAVQFLGVAVIGLIPFVESHLGSVIGVAAGVPMPLAVLAATVGNTLSVLAFVYAGSTVRAAFRRRRGASEQPEPGESRGSSRVLDNMKRFGVPGASLIGPVLLPSQFTSSALVGAGAHRGTVVAWTLVAVVVWGVVSGAMAAGLFNAAGIV
ncbi:hypothetical protein ACFWGD_10940 [Corynebacterium sp. NPDC060344]|uniref:hypothetical protein n=1 Tax=Corynebacterium sp. NPDC060344 TaxID=3347101 RepID=UPI0036672F6E